MRRPSKGMMVIILLLIIATLLLGCNSQNPVVDPNGGTNGQAKGTNKENQNPITTKKSEVNDRDVVPPGNGFYLASNGEAHELAGVGVSCKYDYEGLGINSVYSGSTDIFSGCPMTSSNLPVVLYKSSASQLPTIQIVKFNNYVGVGLGSKNSQVVITQVVNNSSASNAGLMVGDIVLSADGKDLNGDTDTLRSILAAGTLNSQFVMKILRGTTTLDINVTRSGLRYVESVESEIVAKGNYIQIIPKQQLNPGNYACLIPSKVEALEYWEGTCYCFQVK